MATLTSLKDVERQIMSAGLGRISLGDTAPAPGTNTFVLERTAFEEIITDAEQMVTSRIGRFYTLPLSLANEDDLTLLRGIATKAAAYEVWLTINPALTSTELPAAVLKWKTDYEATLEAIVPKGKTTAVEGRDIILEGEALKVAADDPGTANVEFTESLAFGKN